MVYLFVYFKGVIFVAGENLVRPKGFKATIENFWYHYKFHTIVCFFVIVTLVVSIAQCSTKTQYDYKIVVATKSVPLTTGQINAITNELTPYGKDLNGDGEVNINLIDCTMSSDTTDYQTTLAKQQKLQALLMTDTDVMIFITDLKAFSFIKNLNDTGFMENLNLPNGDGYYYDFTNTEVIKNAKAKTPDGDKLIWPEFLISRRIVKGTLFEGRDGIDQKVADADAFIKRFLDGTKN